MANHELPPSPDAGAWWAHENLDPSHYYAAYSFDSAETRQSDVMMLIEEARHLGYPVRYWWLSDAMDLQGSPDRLIVCVHHPSGTVDAGMDLYNALKKRGAAWDDLEKAAVEEYRQFSKPVEGLEGLYKPDGTVLFTPVLKESSETDFLVYYSLSGLMLMTAADARRASETAFAILHALVGKSERAGVTAQEASQLRLSELEVEIDSVEALEFPTDEPVTSPPAEDPVEPI